jgi:hypothetical protein
MLTHNQRLCKLKLSNQQSKDMKINDCDDNKIKEWNNDEGIK